MKTTRWIWFVALLMAMQGPLEVRCELVLRASEFDNMSRMDRSSPFHLTTNYASAEQNVGLVRFDLSGIVQPIRYAKLGIFHLYNPGTNATFGLFRNTEPWTPGSVVSWSTLPAYDPVPLATLHIDDSNWGLWRNVDITDMASFWADGTMPNYGFRLERVDQLNPAIFLEARGYYAPSLAINSGVPEPSAYGLFGVGLLLGLIIMRGFVGRPSIGSSQ